MSEPLLFAQRNTGAGLTKGHHKSETNDTVPNPGIESCFIRLQRRLVRISWCQARYPSMWLGVGSFILFFIPLSGLEVTSSSGIGIPSSSLVLVPLSGLLLSLHVAWCWFLYLVYLFPSYGFALVPPYGLAAEEIYEPVRCSQGLASGQSE